MHYIQVSEEAYVLLTDFAQATGTTATDTANEAISEWINIFGVPRLRRINRQRSRQTKRRQVPVPARVLQFQPK